jgi:hypothetical protein
MKRAIIFGVILSCFLLLGTSSIQPITVNKSIQAQEEQMKEDVNYIIDRLDEIKEKYELLKCKECNKDRLPILICGLLLVFISLLYNIILVFEFIYSFDYINNNNPPLLTTLFFIIEMTFIYSFEFAEIIGCDIWP